MQRYAILGLVLLLGVGFVTWLVITIAAAIVDAVKSSFKVGVDQIKAKRKQRADKEHEREIGAQTKKIGEIRASHPAQVVGVPILPYSNKSQNNSASLLRR
jgi:hypothetical protein